MKKFSHPLIGNFLEPLFHVLVAVTPYIWWAVLTCHPVRPWLLGGLGLLALLPDMDTAASHIGRWLPWAGWLEGTFGHRTLTHSLLAAAAVAVWLRLLWPCCWGWLLWGWLSHLLVDITTSAYGAQLLWPAPYFVTLANVPPSVGLWLVAVALLPAMLLPVRVRAVAVQAVPNLATPTPAPTPLPLPTTWPPCVPPETIRVRVVKVIDGDTVIVSQLDGTTDSVRFLGVNAPEVPHPQFGKPTGEPFGDVAKAWVQANIGSVIYVAFDKHHAKRDKYGRLLAYIVTTQGHLLNVELLRAGLARLFMESGLSCEADLASAAAAAQLKGVGIWSAPTPTPTPTLTPTPTVGYDYQAALLQIQVERVDLQITAVCATATAAPWRYNQAWLDWQISKLTLDESEAQLRLQAWLAKHPPTPTPTLTPTVTQP